MKLNRLGLLCALVSVCVLLSSCSLVPQKSLPESASGTSVAVASDSDTSLPAKDGAPDVFIPAGAVTGEGTLSVNLVVGPDGRQGWNIELEGAQLTGTATLRFENVVAEGRPAPIIGYAEKIQDPIQYVLDAAVTGSDVEVSTTHFSIWFIDSWDWLVNWAEDEIKKIFTDTNGTDPVCEREAEARVPGLVIDSDDGNHVKWCLGKNRDGSTVLKVNNARNYGVSVEATPGLILTKRGADIGQNFQKLIGDIVSTPTRRGNTINIVGPGETVEYSVDAQAGPDLALMVQPSPPAFLATALWFSFQTAGMVWGKPGKFDIYDVADVVDCADALQGMSLARITTAAEAGNYLADAIQGVMPCTGKAFEKIAERSVWDVFAVHAAQVLSWVSGGIMTAATGLKASWDTAMDPSGYQVLIHLPAKGTNFITRDPWNDGTLSSVTEIKDFGGASSTTPSCTGSEIAPRKDGFRCFAAGIYDPCYQSPDTLTSFLCISWVDNKPKVTQLVNTPSNSSGYVNAGTPEGSSIVTVELSDGTVCVRSTGAGPQGVPGYPYWAGSCSGPSAGIWRVGAPEEWANNLSYYPLYAPESTGGRWQVAISIGSETAPARRMDVVRAYR